MSNSKAVGTNRRQILKGMMATSAAVAAPMIVPSRVFGANKKIGIGLIGCGKIMNGHRGSFVGNERTQVRAVCDVKQWQLDKYRDETNALYAKKNGVDNYNDVEGYEMFEDLLARDDIDAVVIGTPDHWHAHASIAAMRAGKDVYCEKPLTLTVEEGKAIRKVSEETGKVLQTGSQQRSDQYFRRAAELILNGYAGNITEIHTRLGSFPQPPEMEEQEIPEGLNYDRWIGQAPLDPYNEFRVLGSYSGGWRCFWEYGARKNGDWGAHHYDIIQWALGMDESGPVKFMPKGHDGVDCLSYQYGNGITVYRDSAKCQAPKVAEGEKPPYHAEMINFYGSDGSVHVGRGSKFLSDPEAIRSTRFADDDERLFESSDHRGNWLDCIESREQPLCSASVGHRTSTICHLSAISERTGEVVNWDPEKEELVDPSDAIKELYFRPRREGYELPA